MSEDYCDNNFKLKYRINSIQNGRFLEETLYKAINFYVWSCHGKGINPDPHWITERILSYRPDIITDGTSDDLLNVIIWMMERSLKLAPSKNSEKDLINLEETILKHKTQEATRKYFRILPKYRTIEDIPLEEVKVNSISKFDNSVETELDKTILLTGKCIKIYDIFRSSIHD